LWESAAMKADDVLTVFIDPQTCNDRQSRDRLWGSYRDRLRRWISFRLDRRLLPRVDASDVAQETIVIADGALNDYLKDPRLPFYPWLCRIALGRIRLSRQRHITARVRSVRHERSLEAPPARGMEVRLVDYLAASGTSPSGHLMREQLREQVRGALEELAPNDRQILELRHIEQLPFAAIGDALGITEGTAKVRHFRALERIQKLLPRM
jgi:RNA polymerase sigma-70 factor (ECF subfamily)